MKKATIDLLLERKLKQDKKSTFTIELKSIGLCFAAVKLPLSQILNIMDKHDVQNAGMVGQFEMFKEMAYMSIPLFREQRLLDAFECVEPTDIVTKVLDDNLNAIAELGTAITNMYGLADGKAITDLKN